MWKTALSSYRFIQIQNLRRILFLSIKVIYVTSSYQTHSSSSNSNFVWSSPDDDEDEDFNRS